MELRKILQAAVQNDAHEIVLAPDEKPRWRRDREWEFFAGDSELEQVLSAALTRIWTFQLLPESHREKIAANQAVMGFWDMHDQKLYYEIHPSRLGFVITLQWLPNEWRDKNFWQFPNWLCEAFTRGQGLNIVAGPKTAVRDAAIESILRSAESQKNFWTVWMKSEGLIHGGLQSGLLTYVESIPSSCDIVIVEELKNLELAISEAEAGKSVIFALNQCSLSQIFNAFMATPFKERFLQQFRWAANVKMVWGMESWLPIYDLVFNSTSVQQVLRSGTLSSLEELVKDADSDSGMRTMNQSLIQYLVRRKIDFKKTFEVSPEPEKLDQMLKSIGI